MLFLPKNDSLIVNILTVIEHSVKNKEKCEVSRVFLKIGHISPLDISSLING